MPQDDTMLHRRALLRLAAMGAMTAGAGLAAGITAASAAPSPTTTYPPTTTRQLRLRGFTFDVLVGGRTRGRPVLLLHGWPEDARVWDGVTPRLHQAGLRTIAPHQRGYSPGARPTDVQAYHLSELRADALALMDKLGIRRFDVIGYDLGGVMAWQLAHDHPERVRTVTVVGTPHPQAYYWAYLNDAEQQQKSSFIVLFQQPPPVPEDILLADDAARLKTIFEPLTVEQVDPFIEPLQQPGIMTLALNWYRAFSLSETGQLGPVEVPTTYLWPNQDRAFSRAAAERTAEWVLGPFRYLELPGISHWALQQAPDTIAPEIVARICHRG